MFPSINGVDFDEIFSPVAKRSSIQIMLNSVSTLNLEVEKMDVNLHETTWMVLS